MIIEISSKEYWTKLNYYDGMLYCSLLVIDGKDDWRLFKNVFEEEQHEDFNTFGNLWYIDDGKISDHLLYTEHYLVVPVRDV